MSRVTVALIPISLPLACIQVLLSTTDLDKGFSATPIGLGEGLECVDGGGVSLLDLEERIWYVLPYTRQGLAGFWSQIQPVSMGTNPNDGPYARIPRKMIGYCVVRCF